MQHSARYLAKSPLPNTRPGNNQVLTAISAAASVALSRTGKQHDWGKWRKKWRKGGEWLSEGFATGALEDMQMQMLVFWELSGLGKAI